MSSVISRSKCPKCKGEDTFVSDYYYRSGEEYCFCKQCGYSHKHFLKRDENHNLVRKMTERFDLRKGEVFFAEVKKTETKEIVAIESIPMLVDDTVELIADFINFHLNSKTLPKRFEKFPKKRKERGTYNNIFHKDENGVLTQLWYLGYTLKIVDGYLEVYEVEWVEEEKGGFGVVTIKNDNGKCFSTYSLPKGEIPTITNDVVFATAIIDGELTVLKEYDDESDMV